MPIRAELRHLYRGPKWEATRRRILERAGGRFDAGGKYLGHAKCERCRRPDRRKVWTIGTSGWSCNRAQVSDSPDQFWSLVKGDGQQWRSSALRGRILSDLKLHGREWTHARQVATQLGIAHLDGGIPGDDRDENLAALCRWCHLYHDRRQHHESRAARKDKTRPLLEASR